MRKKFTIIELLITIVIITIIAGILLPVLNSAKERGVSVQCIGNLRQHGLAFSQYTDINNGIFPFATTLGTTAWSYSVAWQAYYMLIMGKSLHVNVAAVTMKNLCPKVASYKNVWHPEFGDFPEWTRTSFYGMVGSVNDTYVNSFIRKSGNIYFHDPVRVFSPSQKILQVDANNYAAGDNANQGAWGIAILNSSGMADPTSPNRRIAYEHNGAANTLHFDLHVGSYKASALNGFYVTSKNFEPYTR